MLRSLSVLLLGLAFCAGPRFANAQNVPEEYRFAAGLYKQQRWDLAADAFNKFIEKNPNHERVSYARLYRGLAFVNADRFADARQVLRDYARDYPRSKNLPDALYRVAECSYLLDDLQAAESDFDHFLKQFPKHELSEWALPYLADTELRLKKPEAARELFKRAMAQFPSSRLNDDSKFGLARADEDLKQNDEAIALYSQLVQNKQGVRAPQALMALATLRFQAGAYAEASKLFLSLPEKFPTSRLVGSAHLNAGFCFYKRADYERAIAEFQRAAADKDQALTADYWTGVSFKSHGDYAKAAAILKKTYDSNPKSPVAEGALFYCADCELRLGRHDVAEGEFLDLVHQWPKGEYADDGLYFAAEAGLLGGHVDEAQELVTRFEKEFPKSPLRLHKQILEGRILYAKAAVLAATGSPAEAAKSRQLVQTNRAAAIKLFEAVLRESRLPQTIALARFHLGRVLQDVGDNSRVIEVLTPLVKHAGDQQAPNEAVEALVVFGRSQQALGSFETAISTFSKYLSLRPKGGQSESALSERAVCRAQLGQKDGAKADVALLLKQFPQSTNGPETIRRMAETAYDAKEWALAADLFGMMAAIGPPLSDVRRTGFSGVGWSKLQLKSYVDSAKAFEKVFTQYPPTVSQAAEAGYMCGRALQDGGKLEEAVKAYAAAFQKLAPTEPASVGDEGRSPAQYAYLSGIQAATVLAQLKRLNDADEAYRVVVERFPRAANLGQVLYDWASIVHVEKENAEQSRRVHEILGRVVRDFPDSAVNDDARLFAAEINLSDGKIAAADKSFQQLVTDPKADPKVREEALARLVALNVDKPDWPKVREWAQKFLAAFPQSPDLRLIRLHLATAELSLKSPASAEKMLAALKQEVSQDRGESADWLARVWILLAESLHQQQKYVQVESVVADLHKRFPKSGLFYQADEILGRTYKNQAQWDKAITAFQRAIDDGGPEQNETAAKAQLMIAEISFLKKDFAQARLDYLKVYTLYDKLAEWRVPALYQVGRCEEELRQVQQAEQTYADLVKTFPQSEYAKDAQKRLDELRRRVAG